MMGDEVLEEVTTVMECPLVSITGTAGECDTMKSSKLFKQDFDLH